MASLPQGVLFVCSSVKEAELSSQQGSTAGRGGPEGGGWGGVWGVGIQRSRGQIGDCRARGHGRSMLLMASVVKMIMTTGIITVKRTVVKMIMTTGIITVKRTVVKMMKQLATLICTANQALRGCDQPQLLFLKMAFSK